MPDEQFESLSEEAKQYVKLVRFLSDQEATGALSAEEVAKQLTVDSELYRHYLAINNGIQKEFPPLRAAYAVAKILHDLSKAHPEAALRASHITGQPLRPGDGVIRYLKLVTFLEQKEQSGQLSKESCRALLQIDPDLRADFAKWRRGDAVEITNIRANVGAGVIERQMAILYPKLAREFASSSGQRQR
jgi:hypothetical protein